MLFGGSIIRSEPVWGNNQLAVAVNGYLIDVIHEREDGWMEVGYADGDVLGRGWSSTCWATSIQYRPLAARRRA